MKFALLGGKLGHSYSKIIHEMIYKKLNIDASYDLIELDDEHLMEAINNLRNGKYDGYNVTIPHKINVMKYLDEISDEAKEIGAVNTISICDGKVIGRNTDYYGFIESLREFKIDVKNQNVILLGSGGAAKALYAGLKSLGGNILLAVREEDVKEGEKIGKTILLSEVINENFDIIVNATPVGMYPNINESPLPEVVVKRAKAVFDVIYNPNVTKLMSYSKKSINGLYMLVSQAIKACEFFFQRDLGYLTMEIYEELKEVIF